MTVYLDQLEQDLVEAARRRAAAGRPAGRRSHLRLLGVVAAVAIPTATAAAGTTLYALRGSVIPAPRDVPATQSARPASTRLAAFSVADPAPGKLRWTLRLARSRTGLLCSTVGQLQGATFGLVGLDDRFRRLAPTVADSCSVRQPDAATLVGARIFAARRSADERTVVSGIAGGGLRRATLTVAGRPVSLALHPGGVFLTALRGLPEDLGLRVALRFADGHLERHDFGVAPMVVADPAGGHAWRVQEGSTEGDRRTCVGFSPARQRPDQPFSPGACGLLAGGTLHPTGVFFAVRGLTTGLGGPPFDLFHDRGWWRDAAPRTGVWGAAGRDVRSITASTPDHAVHTQTFFRPNGSFLVLFGPAVRAADVAVIVRYRDGRTRTFHGSHRLIDHRVAAPRRRSRARELRERAVLAQRVRRLNRQRQRGGR